MSEEDLKRLVERTVEFRDSRVHVGSVPERFTIPRPEGARLLGAVVRGPEDDPLQVSAYLDVPGDAKTVRASFDALLAAMGFSPRGRTGPPGMGGGFEHTMRRMGQDALYCAGEEGPFYSVAIGDGDPAPVNVMWHSGGMGFSPCASQPPHPMRGMESIPSLPAPPGVMVQGGGGGGSPGAWYAQGIAFTDMAPAALLDHFATELEQGGSRRLAREDAESAAWGRWQMPKTDLETIVAIIAGYPSMRLLMRYTFSPREQTRQVRMMTSGWSSFRLG